LTETDIRSDTGRQQVPRLRIASRGKNNRKTWRGRGPMGVINDLIT